MDCEVCGNNYENPIEVKMNDERHVFDCFECAVHALAPRCSNCGVKIIGHGVSAGEDLFCGAHCARAHGYKAAKDRVGTMNATT